MVRNYKNAITQRGDWIRDNFVDFMKSHLLVKKVYASYNCDDEWPSKNQ